jgi:drug/metabolite transporter (DMT)-like permease
VTAGAYGAVAIAACSWGTWALILRRTDALAPLPTSLESTIVMAVITLVAGLASVRDRVQRPAPLRARAWVAWLGVSDALNILLFFAAYKITIGVSVLTHYLTPVFVSVAAPFVLKEHFSFRTAAAVAASFAGLAVMLVPSHGALPPAAVASSALLAAGSAVFYASNVIVNKFVADAFSPSETMFWHGIIGTPFLAAFVPLHAWAALDAKGAMAAAFLSAATIGPGALGGIAFVWGLRRIPAAHASTLTLLEPLVSVLLGAAVYGEALGLNVVAGGTLIAAGAVLVMTVGV